MPYTLISNWKIIQKKKTIVSIICLSKKFNYSMFSQPYSYNDRNLRFSYVVVDNSTKWKLHNFRIVV